MDGCFNFGLGYPYLIRFFVSLLVMHLMCMLGMLYFFSANHHTSSSLTWERCLLPIELYSPPRQPSSLSLPCLPPLPPLYPQQPLKNPPPRPSLGPWRSSHSPPARNCTASPWRPLRHSVFARCAPVAETARP